MCVCVWGGGGGRDRQTETNKKSQRKRNQVEQTQKQLRVLKNEILAPHTTKLNKRHALLVLNNFALHCARLIIIK